MNKKSALALAIGASLSGLTAVPAALAQEESITEEVLVTGTRIARDPLSTTGPITVISTEAIERSGVANIDELLKRMPSVGTNGIGKNDNNGGAGLAWVDLRNLGATRTLVLVNGRRFVSSTSGVASAVDLGNIPVAMIDRVEVLTDGASAIYGSDAIAGVINIVMKDSFEGTEVSAKLGDTLEGGGDSQELSFTSGLSEERYELVGNISYHKRGEVGYSDRDFAGYNSIYHPNGNIWVGGLGAGFFDQNGDLQMDQLYDLQEMWLSGNSERVSATLNGKYFVSDSMEAYGELTTTRRDSTQQLAGNPIWLNVPIGSFSASQIAQLQEAYIAAGNTGDWTDNYDGVYSRASAGGPRISSQESTTYRALAGLTGDLDNGYTWDVFGSYGRNSTNEFTHNSLNERKLNEAIANGADVLGPWDPELAQQVNFTDVSDNTYEITNFGASLAGELGSLPGGEIGFAVGAEYREESAEFNPSAEAQNGDSAGNQQSPTAGSYNVSEVFAEVNLPILSGVKGVDELAVDVAVRYSDFSSFGGKGTYRVGGIYAPIETLRFRSSYSTSYRAPNVYELYRGASQSYEFQADPCDNDQSTNYQQCLDEGIDENFEHTSGQIPTNIGGNAALKPEEAKTLTAGMVWTPDMVEDLSFTVDYYDIKIENAIGTLDLDYMLDQCYVAGDSAACDTLSVERNPVTGQIENMNGILQNTGYEHVSGWDIELSKGLYFNSGDLFLSAQGSYLSRYDVEAMDGSVQDYVGTVGTTGGIYTPWRGLLTATWTASSDWSVGSTVQYYDGGTSTRGKAMPSMTYVNLNASYDITSDVMLMGGVDNVFDRKPVFTEDSPGGYGELNSEHDVFGTYLWLGVKATF